MAKLSKQDELLRTIAARRAKRAEQDRKDAALEAQALFANCEVFQPTLLMVEELGGTLASAKKICTTTVPSQNGYYKIERDEADLAELRAKMIHLKSAREYLGGFLEHVQSQVLPRASAKQQSGSSEADIVEFIEDATNHYREENEAYEAYNTSLEAWNDAILAKKDLLEEQESRERASRGKPKGDITNSAILEVAARVMADQDATLEA